MQYRTDVKECTYKYNFSRDFVPKKICIRDIRNLNDKTYPIHETKSEVDGDVLL